MIDQFHNTELDDVELDDVELYVYRLTGCPLSIFLDLVIGSVAETRSFDQIFVITDHLPTVGYYKFTNGSSDFLGDIRVNSDIAAAYVPVNFVDFHWADCSISRDQPWVVIPFILCGSDFNLLQRTTDLDLLIATGQSVAEVKRNFLKAKGLSALWPK